MCRVPIQPRPRRGTRRRSFRHARRDLGGGVGCVLLVDLLLMGVTVTAVALAQLAVALVIATGCVSLSRLLARSLLK